MTTHRATAGQTERAEGVEAKVPGVEIPGVEVPGVEVKPAAGHIGADITGVDLA